MSDAALLEAEEVDLAEDAEPRAKRGTSARMNEDHRAWADLQPSTARCAHCPGWGHEGTVAECRAAFEAHRTEAHPNLVNLRRHGKTKALVACLNGCGRTATIPEGGGPYAGWCGRCRDADVTAKDRERRGATRSRMDARERRGGGLEAGRTDARPCPPEPLSVAPGAPEVPIPRAPRHRGRASILGEDDLAAIRARREAGETLASVAADYMRPQRADGYGSVRAFAISVGREFKRRGWQVARAKMVPRSAPVRRAVRVPGRLSARQLDVLRLLAEGYSNVEIAERVYVSVETVKTHVAMVFAQLPARNRTHAVHVGHLLGLLGETSRAALDLPSEGAAREGGADGEGTL